MLLTMKEDGSPYYQELRALHLSPGWARPEPSMWSEPQPKFVPAVWRYAQAKQALDASHNLVPADQTERRNLILVNPIEGNTYATTRNLVAAYQCVMPGDKARTHRHSANALRLVLQGTTGVYTIVNGARIDMHPGDVLLTPGGCWHGHVNETGATGYWLDFLDIPFVQLTEAMFFDPYPQGGLEPITSVGSSSMCISSRQALGTGRDAKTVEIASGVMPTIALNLIRQPKGGRIELPKSTSNAIYAVVLGRVRITSGAFDETLGVGDVAAMPCWHAHAIEAAEDAVVFKVSDDPIFEKLGFARTAN
ncbi:MAG: cupin domain-containing protein [Hyphomicrobiales bacterium]|nr:cupin domain-containing protein [Hyphomicrobiales bacterium]